MIYLHKNIKPRTGNRKIEILISPSIFEQYLARVIGCQEWWNNITKPVLNFRMFKQVRKDLARIYFDLVNFEVIGNIRVTTGGLPYIYCQAGAVFEFPVRFFIYWDGSNFRAYIPVKGNILRADKGSSMRKYMGMGNKNYILSHSDNDGLSALTESELYCQLAHNDTWCYEDFLIGIGEMVPDLYIDYED